MITYESIRSARDFMFEVARGFYDNVVHVNKFGRSTNVDSGVATDIWDGANATDDIDIWVAPTTARGHNIVSASANDASGGTGARTLRIFGLTDWDLEEVSEDITMNGTTDVPTANAYVIIHRMAVLTKGATNINVGLITATANIDDSVTAQINAGEGQTQMAIYGIPSIQNGYMPSYYASFNKSGGATGAVDFSLLVNYEPDAELTNFQVKNTQGLISTGNSHFQLFFQPYFKIAGPAIVKVQGNGSAANLDASAGFDMILVRES